jgi:hypothetical protein
MRQINPWAKAWANAERTDINRDKWIAHKNRRIIKGNEFLEGHHLYERTFSEVSSGESRVMNGREAKALNDELFKDFLYAVEKNKKGRRLERWRVADRFAEAPITNKQTQ